MVPIDRKSSIETEPRTLNIHEMQFAREAAVCVVNSSTTEEALRNFTEGLKPVTSIREQHQRRVRDNCESFPRMTSTGDITSSSF